MTPLNEIALFDAGAFLPCPVNFNMAAYTLAWAEKTPDKVALELIASPGTLAEVWRFGDLAGAVRASMTGLMRAGVSPGDRVLLRLDHSVDFPILFFAATGLGAVPVPTSPQLTAPEVATIEAILKPVLTLAAHGIEAGTGRQIGPGTYRGWRGLTEADFAPTTRDDPAYMVFTSGTGGQPKGVVHAHRAAWARRMMWRDWVDLHATDRVLHAGAFNWTYTLGTGLTDPWAAGATALILRSTPRPGTWPAVIEAHDPTIFAAAPGVYRQLLRDAEGTDAEAFASLRHALSAGEALSPALRSAWQTTTRRPIFEALGMSEISTYASQSPAQEALRPQRGRRVAVLTDAGQPAVTGEEGDLAVSSRDPGLMLGYWQGPDLPPRLPLSGEWFLTGDRARMDRTGGLTHTGRADDMLNVQGYRVTASEVEAALASHPRVSEVAVFAQTVRAGVEVIAAAVVPVSDDGPVKGAGPQGDRPGDRPGDLSANLSANLSVDLALDLTEILLGHCQSRLARYKCPRIIHLVPGLPRTATGKVLKRALAQKFSTTP